MFINENNTLVKYLILELFEKLYRLKKYITICEKFDRKNNNDKIINLFKESIRIIGIEIPGRAVRFLPAPPQTRASSFPAHGSSIYGFAN